RHTRSTRDWSSDVCSSDLTAASSGPKSEIRNPKSDIEWLRQAKGSLAGEDVEPMTQGGLGFLFDVQRARFDGAIVARWHIGDEEIGRASCREREEMWGGVE